MKKVTYLLLLLVATFHLTYGQSVDAPFARKKMRKDLKVFKNIRLKANSGLYKYRTPASIDSIYQWAEQSIDQANTYRDFYNIISTLTDFEGSLHNDASWSSKFRKSLKKESKGYFPYPVKLIENKVVCNLKGKEIPLGAQISSINNHPIHEVIAHMYKYYTTDGVNISGKAIGINRNFAFYYRLHYGLSDTFEVTFTTQKSSQVQTMTLQSVGYQAYYANFKARFSAPFDETYYKDWQPNEVYTYKNLGNLTGLLTINTFSIGGRQSAQHLKYKAFLDSVFTRVKQDKIAHLIVDVRNNGGGTDPNDLVTYAYLAQNSFRENKQAWISFRSIPCLRYIESSAPFFLRLIGVTKYNKALRKEFPLEKNGKYYQDASNEDHQVIYPHKNAFKGNIYLLVSPRVASAGSLFAAMVAGNKNTVVVGEETMGGYYGHNGHTSLTYILPKSKIATSFSIVNLRQDVPMKANQKPNRGIIPDYQVPQTFQDYLHHVDTPMNFVIDMIKKRSQKK